MRSTRAKLDRAMIGLNHNRAKIWGMQQFWIRLRLIFLIVLIGLGCLLSASPVQALTQEQRLVSEAWRVVDRAYVDYTFNHQNWWQVRQNALQQPLPDREAAYTAIQSMLSTLEDPFTRLLRPDQYHNLQTTTSGELMGLGLQVAIDTTTGVLEVIAPISGSPAERAGIKARDRILKIDGVPTQDLSLDDAAARMRGAIGTTVTLTLQRPDLPDQAAADVVVTRGHITLNPLTSEIRQTPSGQKIALLRLSQFNANAASEVEQAIRADEKQGVKGYILDLRNNPGGLLQAGIEIARYFLDEGTIVFTVNRQGIESSFDSTGSALTHAPLVVLINQGTASASEILAGALQDLGRAELVGERSFGKGLIQSLFELEDGSGLAVTVAHYETPAHRDIHKQGIQPDIQVAQASLTHDQIGTTADQQYQAALELLDSTTVAARAT